MFKVYENSNMYTFLLFTHRSLLCVIPVLAMLLTLNLQL